MQDQGRIKTRAEWKDCNEEIQTPAIFITMSCLALVQIRQLGIVPAYTQAIQRGLMHDIIISLN
jgi:hypothetical protein